MSSTEHEKSSPIDPTPFFAVVGATDIAVARVRSAVLSATAAQAQLEKAVSTFDARAAAQAAPSRAVSVALTVASKSHSHYEDLAKRGKDLVGRVQSQRSTREFLAQGRGTIGRTRGAVTTARRAADDTAASLRDTVGIARRESADVVTTAELKSKSAAGTTERAAKATSTRTRTNAKRATTAAKDVRTSAARTAKAAGEAATDAAAEVGG